MSVVDAHIHQWDPFTTPRVASGAAKITRRVPLLLPVLVRMLPRASRDFVGDPRHMLTTYLPGDYAADAVPLNVDTVVHVEASWQGHRPIDAVDETRWVSSLPFGENGAPKLGAIVVHADPSQPDAAQVLDAHLQASPLVKGVRCVAAHSPDRGIVDFAKRPNMVRAGLPAWILGGRRTRSQLRDLALRPPPSECRHAGERVPRHHLRARSLRDTGRSPSALRQTHRNHPRRSKEHSRALARRHLNARRIAQRCRQTLRPRHAGARPRPDENTKRYVP